MTLDGWQLDVTTGDPLKPHKFTAPSKESLHVAILGHALTGNAYAAYFYSKEEALDMLDKKVKTYEQFNK